MRTGLSTSTTFSLLKHLSASAVNSNKVSIAFLTRARSGSTSVAKFRKNLLYQEMNQRNERREGKSCGVGASTMASM